MEQNSTKTEADGTMLFAGEAWFDPIEAGIRDRVRGFIQELLEQELAAALGRTRHERVVGEPKGYRNGTRDRQLSGKLWRRGTQRAAGAHGHFGRRDTGMA